MLTDNILLTRPTISKNFYMNQLVSLLKWNGVEEMGITTRSPPGREFVKNYGAADKLLK